MHQWWLSANVSVLLSLKSCEKLPQSCLRPLGSSAHGVSTLPPVRPPCWALAWEELNTQLSSEGSEGKLFKHQNGAFPSKFFLFKAQETQIYCYGQGTAGDISTNKLMNKTETETCLQGIHRQLRCACVGAGGGWTKAGEGISRRTGMNNPQTETTVRRWPAGRRGGGWVEVGKGGKWEHL